MKAFSSVRRHLLAVVAGGVAGTFASKFVWAGTQYSSSDTLARRLAGVFAAGNSAAAIGREYLRARPDEADWQTLVDRLLKTDLSAIADADLSPAQIEACVQARVRADFVDGRIVDVGGWALSQTEARLCALAALR